MTLLFFIAFDIKIESDIDERIVDKQCQAFLKLIMRVTTCYNINFFSSFYALYFLNIFQPKRSSGDVDATLADKDALDLFEVSLSRFFLLGKKTT